MYTRKEYHNPSITKTYSVGFSHDVELLCGIFYLQQSSSLIGKENLESELKDQTVNLLEITESIGSFYRCLPISFSMSTHLQT